MIAAEDPSSAALLFVVLLHLVSIPETDRQFSALKGPAIQFTPAQEVRQTQAPHFISDIQKHVIAFLLHTYVTFICPGKRDD